MFRELSIPSHIHTLEDIHEQEESDEDGGEVPVDEFDKDDRPLHKIEGFGHVHHATKDITTVPDEVTK